MHRREVTATLPSLLWLSLLFVWPALNLVLMAFRPADLTGGVASGWSMEAWSIFGQSGVLTLVLRTVGVTCVVTLICLLLAVPVAWRIATAPAKWRPWLLMLIVLPLWTSLLVRVFAWRVLLQSSGPVSQLLSALGLIESGTSLLYNTPAVMMVMITCYLPMAVLPLYAAMERIDSRLLEAARDLGATAGQAFFNVVLPSVRQALIAAALIVGIPCLGAYLIPDMIGGTHSELLGSRIGQRLLTDRQLPQAAALAVGLAVIALPAVLLSLRRKEEGAT